jgi:hypothetical protein
MHACVALGAARAIRILAAAAPPLSLALSPSEEVTVQSIRGWRRRAFISSHGAGLSSPRGGISGCCRLVVPNDKVHAAKTGAGAAALIFFGDLGSRCANGDGTVHGSEGLGVAKPLTFAWCGWWQRCPLLRPAIGSRRAT